MGCRERKQKNVEICSFLAFSEKASTKSIFYNLILKGKIECETVEFSLVENETLCHAISVWSSSGHLKIESLKANPSIQQQIIYLLASGQVPRGDVSKLQANFWVNNLMSLLTVTSRNKTKKLICGNCDSGDAATSRCTDCGVFLCEFCVKAHKRLHNLKHHQILTLAQVRSGGAKALVKPMRCAKHKDELLKLFCGTCDKPICRDCTIVDHQRHSYAFVEDVINQKREMIKEKLQETKAKAPDLTEGLEAVEEMRVRVKAQKRRVTQQIDSLKVQQFRALDEVFNKMHEDLETLCKTKLERLQAQRDGLMLTQGQVESSIEYTQHTLDDVSDVELLSMKKQLVTNLSKLNATRWNCEPCEEDTMKLIICKDFRQVASGVAMVSEDIPCKKRHCGFTFGNKGLGKLYQ